jgi:peptidoglycan-associated lipoprotein
MKQVVSTHMSKGELMMNAFKSAIVAIGCFSVMMSASGCANKEVVKKDEPISKQATTNTKTATDPKTVPVTKKEELKKTSAAPVASSSTAAQKPEKMTKMGSALEKIYFDFDRSDLSTSARDTLSRDATILLKEQRDAKVRIEGNCDERGSAEYNLALGERRAKEAAKYLTTLGVQQERLSVVSYGKEKPAVQGSNEEAWAKNRRDEFIIQK